MNSEAVSRAAETTSLIEIKANQGFESNTEHGLLAGSRNSSRKHSLNRALLHKRRHGGVGGVVSFAKLPSPQHVGEQSPLGPCQLPMLCYVGPYVHVYLT